MRKLIVLAAMTAALAATAVTTTACNTVKGAGEDVSAAGDAVSRHRREGEAELSRLKS